MDKEDFIAHWVESSERDYRAMLHLFASKDFHWSLFIEHLVIEKLLKALHVSRVGSDAPRIHDLLRPAQLAGLEMTDSGRTRSIC